MSVQSRWSVDASSFVNAAPRTPVLRPITALFAARARASGDRARNERRWGDALEAYAKVLHLTPDSAAIWVQLGHCLKESGDAAEAEKAYLRARQAITASFVYGRGLMV
jgi:tetratricopeptide (TPR) repeat protein